MTKTSNTKAVTGYDLKLIALVTMLIDHIAAVVLWPVYEASYRITASMQLSQSLGDKIIVWTAEHQEFIYSLYEIMRYIGRMAFPIYCFLLVEGFLHTRSAAKYAGRLALFAVISEIPFDLAIAGEWWTLEYSNVFFTLVLGLLAIWAFSYVEKKLHLWQQKQNGQTFAGVIQAAAGIVIAVVLGGLAEYVLHTDYGFGGVAAILVMYLLRKQRDRAFAAGVFVLTIFCGDTEILALFMLFFLHRYDGTRGKNMKYVFYAFYPAHLLVLALLCIAIGA